MIANIFAFVLVLIFVLMSFFGTYKILMQPSHILNKIMRGFSFMLGVAIYFVSKQLNIPISNFIFNFGDSTGGAIYYIFNAIAPFAIGAFVLFIMFSFIDRNNRNDETYIYFVIVVLTLLNFFGLDIITNSLDPSNISPLLLPNASFVCGILAMMLFGPIDTKKIISKILRLNHDNDAKLSTKSSGFQEPLHKRWREDIDNNK